LKDRSPSFQVVFYIGLAGSIRSEDVVEKEGEWKECAGMRIHPLVKVFSSGEKIGNGIGVSRDVLEDKVKVLQEFHPSGLSAHDLLRLVEVQYWRFLWSVLMAIG
jgi:hypothetical protein